LAEFWLLQENEHNLRVRLPQQAGEPNTNLTSACDLAQCRLGHAFPPWPADTEDEEG